MTTVRQREQATMDFERAHRRALWNRMRHRLAGKSAYLPTLVDMLTQQCTANVIDRRSQTIRIDQIVGSWHPNFGFDANFMPTKTNMRQRWLRIRLAYFEQKNMPAIDVIQVGDCYYIRDGHHRVSVARFLGQAFIDANVIVYEVYDRAATV